MLNRTNQRLLLIFAHPDDESFALGGTIAKAAAEGVEVWLAVATRGEAGKTAGVCTEGQLAAVRERELRQAAGILGIAQVRFLDYLDKEVAGAPPLEMLEKLVSLIREFRPQVIITFGPDGASGHRDHRAIHYWTKSAVYMAGQYGISEWGERYTVPRLCYIQSTWRLPFAEWPQVDYVISTADYAYQKWEAVKAHETQKGSRRKFESLIAEQKERYFGHEHFVCDWKSSAYPGRGEDLFEGLEQV